MSNLVNSRWARFLVVIVMSFLLSGCIPDSLGASGSNPSNGNSDSLSSSTPKPEESIKITIYYSTKDALYLVPTQKTIAKKEKWLEEAVALLASTEPGTAPTIPFKDFVESIQIDGTTAYVNIKQESILKSPKGATLEQVLIQSIVYTIVKNTDVKKVAFTVDKKQKETLLGHVDILDPIEPDDSMIKK